MVHDSDWGRLAGAWHFGRTRPQSLVGATLRDAARLSGFARHQASLDRPRVLVVWDDDASTLASSALVGGAAFLGGPCSFEIAEPTSTGAFEQMLEEPDARIVLIDVDTCDRYGLVELRRLRRRRADVAWILSWEKPSPRWIEVLIATEAKGCVVRNSDIHALHRAVEAVLHGELWFPRTVLQWLYMALLNAPLSRLEPRAVAVAPEGLSLREAEVMALMRQGLTNKQIAETLKISVNTVKKHVAHAFEKRGLHKRRQAFD